MYGPFSIINGGLSLQSPYTDPADCQVEWQFFSHYIYYKIYLQNAILFFRKTKYHVPAAVTHTASARKPYSISPTLPQTASACAFT